MTRPAEAAAGSDVPEPPLAASLRPRRVLVIEDTVDAAESLRDLRRALEAGFDEHLAKPLQPENLSALLGGVWTVEQRA